MSNKDNPFIQTKPEPVEEKVYNVDDIVITFGDITITGFASGGFIDTVYEASESEVDAVGYTEARVDNGVVSLVYVNPSDIPSR